MLKFVPKNSQPITADARKAKGGAFQRLTQTQKESKKSTLNPEEVLPPFEVLMSWLSYSYRITGEWPTPPEEDSSLNFTSSLAQKRQPQNANKIAPIKLEDVSSNIDRVTSGNKPTNSTSVKFDQIDFDYVNSIYFVEATRIIETFSRHPIPKQFVFGCKQVLSLILAWCQFPLFANMSNRKGGWMILATGHCTRQLRMRVSSFRQYVVELEAAGLLRTEPAGGKMLGREAFEQLRYDCSKTETLFGKQACTYWSGRSVQPKTTVYSFDERVWVDSTLPIFNPFTGTADTDKAAVTFEEQELPQNGCFARPVETAREIAGNSGKYQNTSQVGWERQSEAIITISRSFPGIPCYESIHDDNDKPDIFKQDLETKNNVSQNHPLTRVEKPILSSETTDIVQTVMQPPQADYMLMVAEGLTPEQKTKFEFLNNQATFKGYCRKDGRATLDTPEALKFALKSHISFEQLTNRYNQVNEMWINGLCRKNPIGLLHWAIQNDCDPRGLDDLITEVTLKPELYQAEGPLASLYSGRRNNVRSTFSKQSNGQFSRRRTVNGKASSQKFPIAAKFAQVDQPQEEGENDADQSTNDQAKDIQNKYNGAYQSENNVQTLWEEVVGSDLAGRFALDKGKLNLLTGAYLEVIADAATSNEEKQTTIVVKLRSIVEEAQLDMATQNIVRLAFRQRFGPGYNLIFTSCR